MRKTILLTLCGAFSLAAFCARSAMAQPPGPLDFVPDEVRGAAPQNAGQNSGDPNRLPDPSAIQNLEVGLKWIVWNEQTRGPLLVIGADMTTPYMPKQIDPTQPFRRPEPLPPAEYRTGWRAETISTYFGRKVTRLGSISVLSPRLMTVLNTRLPANVDTFAGLRSYERMQLFQASLTEDQWRKMATDEGLGVSDLDAKQRDLFLGLIPEGARLQRTVQRARWAEVVDLNNQNDLNPANREGKLSQAQRLGARMRINRTVHMWLPDAENGNTYSAWVPDRLEGAETWSISDPHEWNNTAEVYGVKLSEEVPARLKAGSLDYEAPSLNTEIPLGQAKTVGDLIKQIANATHAELYADGRLISLKVSVRAEEGDTARAGDLLKALALAVTGTYRQVGPAFVLTDDVEGIGTRLARIQEWQQKFNAQRNRTMQDFWKRLRKLHPSSFIQFAPGDPMAMDDKLTAKLDERQRVVRSGNGLNNDLISTSELSPAMQKQIRMAVRAHDEEIRNNPEGRPVTGDLVSVRQETRMSLLIPGLGAVDLPVGGIGLDMMQSAPRKYVTANGRSADLPFAPPPGMAANGGLLFTPQTTEDIDQAADTVRRAGLKQLWIQMPLDPEQGKDLLTAAAQAAKERNLTVFAVLHLMQAPVKSQTKTDRTPVTILGETASEYRARRIKDPEEYPGQFLLLKGQGDWLDPSDPATLPLIKKRIFDLAAIPGVAGVVLSDIAIPGYDQPGTNNSNFYTPFSGGELGYTPENRLGMLRETSYDPIDIPASGNNFNGYAIQLPFFPEPTMNWVQLPGGTWGPDPKVVLPTSRWHAYRYKATLKLLADLYKVIAEEKPSLKILISPTGPTWSGGAFTSWDAPDQFANNAELPGQNSAPAGPSAKTQILDINLSWLMISYQNGLMDDDTPLQTQFNRSINQMLDWQKANRQGKGWEGFVLDLGEVPVKDMAPLIQAGIAPAGSQTAEK